MHSTIAHADRLDLGLYPTDMTVLAAVYMPAWPKVILHVVHHCIVFMIIFEAPRFQTLPKQFLEHQRPYLQ